MLRKLSRRRILLLLILVGFLGLGLQLNRTQLWEDRQVFAGYDNIVARRPKLGGLLRDITYAMEKTPLELFGLSHLLVVERSDENLNSALF